ncbi:MAG: HYR domain-containing protein [Pseudomonadota bacterium]
MGGGNGFGQLGNGTATNSATPVQSLINLSTIPVDVELSLLTSQPFLDSLLAVQGNIALINVGGRDLLIIPNLASVGLDVTVTGNDQLVVVDLGALQSAGGSIDISGNLAMTTLDLGALTDVGGSVTLTNDPNLSAILISGVSTIGGNLTLVWTAATVINMAALVTVSGSIDISDNQGAGAIDMSSLTTVSGGVTIDNNTAANPINMAALTSSGELSISGNTAVDAIDMSSLVSSSGGVTLDGNTSAAAIDMGALTTVAGGLTISDNTSASTIDMAALTTVSGGIDIIGNTSAGGIDLGSLTQAAGIIDISDNASAGGIDISGMVSAGEIDIAGNGSASVIDMSSLTTVSGDVAIENNGDAAINMSSGTTVSGNVSIETTGSGAFDMGDGVISGGLSLDTTGYTDVSGTTAGGDTNLTNTMPDAVMHLQILSATFTAPVSFSVTHLDSVALVPEAGLTADGAPATIDPIAGYLFTFSTPELNRDASLSFDVHVAGLDAASQAQLLAAVATGTATMATKSDALGSVFQAFDICTGGAVPSVDGCVLIETLDASGVPTLDTPAIVRFSNVVGHFSTWAVVIATPNPVDVTPPVFSNVPANIVAAATGPNGAVVSYALPTAIDAVSGACPVICVPASGTTFPIGPTSVTCSATDSSGNTATAGFSVTVTAPQPPPARVKVLYATLVGGRFPDVDTFAFKGVKGEKVTVRLVPDSAGSYTNGSAVLVLIGIGVLKTDATTLPNVVTTTLPRTGTYYVTVSEVLKRTGRFSGAYAVSLESTLAAWSTFVPK